MALAALGFAALIGVIAVVDADGTGSALGIGAGVAVTIFVAGGNLACALACLARRRAEILALGSIAASALAIDLFVLSIWREIDDETTGSSPQSLLCGRSSASRYSDSCSPFVPVRSLRGRCFSERSRPPSSRGSSQRG
jgi:hypothetical protein